jgi:hypothetical protein
MKMELKMKKKRVVNHAQLVKAGKLWVLGQSGRCKVALVEFYSGEHEIPDILAFRNTGLSVMIECKASRADFLKDKKKHSRQFDKFGLGMEKWYLVAPDVTHDVKKEIPEGWGCLLYCPSKHTRGYYLSCLARAARVNDMGKDEYEYLLSIERRILIRACARAVEAQRLTSPLAITNDLGENYDDFEDSYAGISCLNGNGKIKSETEGQCLGAGRTEERSGD